MKPKKNVALAPDPRKPEAVVSPNERWTQEALEPPPDYVAFVGLLFAMVAMILRNKTMAWVGLGLGFSSLTQFNWRTADVKQITSAIVFSSAGLIAAYASPKNVH